MEKLIAYIWDPYTENIGGERFGYSLDLSDDGKRLMVLFYMVREIVL